MRFVPQFNIEIFYSCLLNSGLNAYCIKSTEERKKGMSYLSLKIKYDCKIHIELSNLYASHFSIFLSYA